jgi:pantoate--beta-alanine ligase
MQVIHSSAEMTSFVRRLRGDGRTLGFVPTMGALHRGHLSLIRRAKQQCDAAILSIFVNPAQFGPSEDFDRYPRALEKDLEILRPFNIDACFAPAVEEIYPAGFATFVDPGPIGDRLEGASRPGHFRGVATVVLKLFNIVAPDVAYFGQKDFQQTVVIRQLVRDFNLPVRVVVCPIVRDGNGVAVSSRNFYLSSDERESARALSRGLNEARELVAGGETDSARVAGRIRQVLESDPAAKVEYVEIADRQTLDPVSRIAPGSIALAAVRIGSARLIDNLILGPAGSTDEDLLELGEASYPGSSVAMRPPGLETETLRLKVQRCRECAAMSSVVLPPREFMLKYLKNEYTDLNAIRVLVIGRDAPWGDEHFVYRSPASNDHFLTRLLELTGMKNFAEFKATCVLTDALRCHSIVSPVPERALANCARHLREELKLFPALQTVILLGEDAYLQFQRFILGRRQNEIRPWTGLLAERGWASEELTIAGLTQSSIRAFYCYHPTSGYQMSPSIVGPLALR